MIYFLFAFAFVTTNQPCEKNCTVEFFLQVRGIGFLVQKEARRASPGLPRAAVCGFQPVSRIFGFPRLRRLVPQNNDFGETGTKREREGTKHKHAYLKCLKSY
jgi:hypothetical protein